MFPREKRFANLLDKQNRKWQYPAPRFKIGNTYYRPDFYLPDEKLFIEVVGTRQAYHANKKKIAEFKRLYPYIKFIIVDYESMPYPYLFQGIEKGILAINRKLKIEPYFESYVLMCSPHYFDKCGSESWNPKICLTCKTIMWYRKGKRFNSKENFMDYLRARKVLVN